MSAPLALAVILAVALPLTLLRAYRVPAPYVERWARDHGLELTPDSRVLVARYLRNARVLRAWGGVAGVVLPSLIELALHGRVVVLGFGTDGDSAPLAFGAIFIGYLVGALCAEVSLVRPVPGARRSARLARRELESYLPRRVMVAQRALAATGALGALAVAVVPYKPSVSTPGAGSLVLVAVAVLAFGAGVEAIERWLVRRPQPYTNAPLVAADDAIRAQSVHAVAGAGLALLLLFCSGISLVLQESDAAALHWTMVVPAVAFLVLSLVACSTHAAAA